MTLFEVVVVAAIVMILAALLLQALAVAKKKSSKINCTNNLKQVDLAFRIWAGDNGDIYPMGVSVTNGGAMEMVQTGNVLQIFMVMSNELSTPKILYCPEDASGDVGMYFHTLSATNVSYFSAVDVTNEINPRLILSGDCNFTIAKKPVKSGMLSLWVNDPVAWEPPRHGANGNLGFADGSVQSATPSSLHNYLIQTGVATNRLAIP